MDYTLYGITDSKSLKGGISLEHAVTKAIAGGITFLQYREKNLSYAECLEQAKKIQMICREHGVGFVINDDVKLAKEIGAGVHLGQGDMDIRQARAILGNDTVIGVTAKTTQQATEAEKGGASYIGVGACFASSTKVNALPISKNEIVNIRKSVKIPMVLIGGINEKNVSELKGLGANGICAIATIFASDDIETSTRGFRCLVDKVVSNEV